MPVKRSKNWIVYPFLLAAFPVFSIYYSNIVEVFPFAFVLSLVVSLLFSFSIFLTLRFLFKDSFKAGLLTGIFLAIFFSHGHLHNFISSLDVDFVASLGIDKILFSVWTLTFVICSLLIYRTKRNLQLLTKLLNFATFLLVVIPFFGSFIYEISNFDTRINRQPISINEGEINSENVVNTPDIYYIILDRYASNQTLRDFYKFDNHYFTDSLKKKGFYFAEEALSNYPRTLLSLAASLNMEYVNYLSDFVGENSSDQTFAYPLVDKHKVGEYLKELGYQYLHLGSWFEPTKVSSIADQNFLLGDLYVGKLDGFSTQVLNTTLLSPILRKFFPATASGNFSTQHANRILYQFNKIEEIAASSGDSPKFIFAHILIPHPPFVFDQSCQVASNGGTWTKDSSIEGYNNQLNCANQLVLKMVDKILSSSSNPPVIVIQADEGPYARRYPMPPGRFNFKEASDNTLKERFGIFNALYLPDVGNDNLYPTLSQVNTFRVIFNTYFGADLDLLPDKSYIYPDEDHFYKFIDVTERLRR